MRPVRTQTGTTGWAPGTTNYDTSKFALDRYKSNKRLHVTGTNLNRYDFRPAWSVYMRRLTGMNLKPIIVLETKISYRCEISSCSHGAPA